MPTTRPNAPLLDDGMLAPELEKAASRSNHASASRVASSMAFSRVGDIPLPRTAPFLSTNRQPYSSGAKYVLPSNHGPPAGVRSIQDPLSSLSVSVIAYRALRTSRPALRAFASARKIRAAIFGAPIVSQIRCRAARIRQCTEGHRESWDFWRIARRQAMYDHDSHLNLFPPQFYRQSKRVTLEVLGYSATASPFRK